MDSSEKDYKRLYQEALTEIDSLKNQVRGQVFSGESVCSSDDSDVYQHSTDYFQFPILLIRED
jgi:hypothetical protein